ncbi:MAG: hypothetical protein MI864_11415, partial [Pseudomonadales bacterium]|nr:hypothetical protein [Pseudomonadales bacterium]
EHPVPQLGMKLFFSKSLGGQFDSACVTCHHPALGGADRLSLSVGVDALDPDLLGPGRQHQNGAPIVPRNAPTIFNTGLWDTGLFFDSRVESIGKEPGTNGMLSGIRTPDSAFFTPDENAGANLAAAQARFPVTSAEEMKSENFESGSDNETIREHLAQRIGGYGPAGDELPANSWLDEFRMAFGSTAPAEDLITFDNIAFALGEYERSMVFDNTPWSRYTAGDLNAINEAAKQGARLFFTPVAQGGAGCGACHNGPLFSDGQHHNVAFPHIGPGKGDGNNDDFGRERETGDPVDRYRFRTPSLLNIATTAPYGRTGVYTSLQQVVRHYVNPQRSVQTLFDRGGACSLPQYRNVDDCELLYPENEANSILALQKLQQERQQGISRFQSPRLDNQQVDQLVAFLESLTDDCVQDRACLSRWIADPESSGPDGNQLNAHDPRGNTL